VEPRSGVQPGADIPRSWPDVACRAALQPGPGQRPIRAALPPVHLSRRPLQPGGLQPRLDLLHLRIPRPGAPTLVPVSFRLNPLLLLPPALSYSHFFFVFLSAPSAVCLIRTSCHVYKCIYPPRLSWPRWSSITVAWPDVHLAPT